MLLFLLIAGLLILTYLLVNIPQQPVKQSFNQEFAPPSNSLNKPIPLLYGTGWLAGNFLAYDDVQQWKVEVCY
jgi:hypothetical protein